MNIVDFLFSGWLSGLAFSFLFYYLGLRPLKPKLKENFIKEVYEATHNNAYANYDKAIKEAMENLMKEGTLEKLFPKTMNFIKFYDYKNYNRDEVFGLRTSSKDSKELKKLRKDFNKSCKKSLKKDILEWI